MPTITAITVLALGLMALALPIGFSLMLAGIGVVWWNGHSLMIVPQQIISGIDSFTLLAVPFFLLAGELMTVGGMTTRLLGFAIAIVGRFRGGLAITNVLSAVLMAGISGSAVADTSALGKVLIPGMVRAGYSPAFAAALTAAANIVGPIIPPSIAFILIGVLANLSITRLFLAGILPGLVYALAMLVMAVWISRKRNYPVHHAATLPEFWIATRNAFWALMMPVLIIGGIRTGVFNVTECSAFAVLYALFVGGVIHRELTLHKVWRALVGTARATAIIMFILGGAHIISWLLAYNHIPQQIADLLLSISDNPIVFLLLINIMLIVVGTFMEVIPSMIILVPILFPVAASLGIDLYHFSVIVALNLVIGLITPPVSVSVSIAAMIGRVSTGTAMYEVIPFFFAAIGAQLLVTYLPFLSLWIPALLMGAN